MVVFEIPGNQRHLRVRITAGEPAVPESCGFEAWYVDGDGKRTSAVTRGNSGFTPEDAMGMSHWHDLEEPPGLPDDVDAIRLPRE